MTLTIGQASRRTGIKIPTIRYYENSGLLPPFARTDSGRRVFDEATVQRLGLIRHARHLGFSMKEIRVLLDLQTKPAVSCEAADLIARQKLDEVDARIRQLQSLRDSIEQMIDSCSHQKVQTCKVLSGLAECGCDAQAA